MIKDSTLDVSKASNVSVIAFKRISMTSFSVQAGSQILTLCRRSDTPHWAEGWSIVHQKPETQISTDKKSTD